MEKKEPYGDITHKVMRIESFRRIMVIQKEATSNFVILSIDPMGLGSSVYRKIDENISYLNNELHLDFNSFFDTMEVDKAMFKLIEDSILVPQGVSAIDESTKKSAGICSI